MKHLPWILLACVFCGTVAPCAAAATAQALLQRADDFRAGNANTQLETEVLARNAEGDTEKTRRYSVFIGDPRHTLIVMRSPAEVGQKVLMVEDDYWLVLPGSQRPLRITASQKLLGDASTGDIASLSWSDNYEGTVVGEESCTVGQASRPCIRLSLQASRKGVSYRRIELWLGRDHGEPLSAEYYIQSDKLAKRASFAMDNAKEPRRVTEMQLQNELGDRKSTVVRYLSSRQRELPPAWFNPMYLTREFSIE